jgi:hypothetical protein
VDQHVSSVGGLETTVIGYAATFQVIVSQLVFRGALLTESKLSLRSKVVVGGEGSCYFANCRPFCKK